MGNKYRPREYEERISNLCSVPGGETVNVLARDFDWPRQPMRAMVQRMVREGHLRRLSDHGSQRFRTICPDYFRRRGEIVSEVAISFERGGDVHLKLREEDFDVARWFRVFQHDVWQRLRPWMEREPECVAPQLERLRSVDHKRFLAEELDITEAPREEPVQLPLPLP